MSWTQRRRAIIAIHLSAGDTETVREVHSSHKDRSANFLPQSKNHINPVRKLKKGKVLILWLRLRENILLN